MAMKRVKLKEYAIYPHQLELEVRVTDLYYQAHLSYDRLISLTQHVRVKLLESIGVSERDLGDGRAGVSVPDVKMVMTGEASMGDIITFETGVIDTAASAFRIGHRVKASDGRLIALLEITVVAYDYAAGKVASLPPKLLRGLAQLKLMDPDD